MRNLSKYLPRVVASLLKSNGPPVGVVVRAHVNVSLSGSVTVKSLSFRSKISFSKTSTVIGNPVITGGSFFVTSTYKIALVDPPALSVHVTLTSCVGAVTASKLAIAFDKRQTWYAKDTSCY